MKRSGLMMILSMVSMIVFGQGISLKGRLTDKADKTVIAGATVELRSQKDSSFTKLLVTDNKGEFNFTDLEPATYIVKISPSGYEKIEQKIALQASNKDAIPFSVNRLAKELENVTIISKAPPVKQKGDTSEFSASQFKVNPDATAEDMIKKLPGLTVAKDGTVTAMGEQVKKVTVDGRDFFGDDATAALKNLPADVIDKIQIFDKLSDQAQLTGFDDGNSIKTVNIVTKSGIKNGQFGRIYAGAGTDGRYQAGGNVSFFKGDRRLSLVGNFNNINLQNFSTQDLLGVTSGGGGGGFGGRGGGGRGGGGGGFGGGQDNFNVGQASGISKTNSFGLNFSNVYNKKLTLTGSYFFNNSNNTNSSLSNSATTIGDSILNAIQNSNSSSTNTNHRINLRLEYKIDSANSLFIIPSLSFQKNNSSSYSNIQSFYNLNDSNYTSNGFSNSDRNGYNLRNNILFRHSFKKRGRSLTLGFNTAWSKNDGTSINDIDYRIFKAGIVVPTETNNFTDNTTTGTTIGGSIAYTEPVGKKGQLQIDYTPSVQKNKADQQVFRFDGKEYSIFDTSKANRFDNTITTNNVGANYRLGRSRDEQLSFGVNFQTSTLESQRTYPSVSKVNQTFSNFLPNLMWRKKLSTVSNIRVFYRASVNFPSINQLQDVINPSDSLYITSGNPDLKQSYTHFLTGRYSYTNSKTSTSFFANILLQTANDYIANAIYIPKTDTIIQTTKLPRGGQFVKPVNLDGYRSLRTFFTYSMPLKFIKTTLNLNAGFSYGTIPGMVNYQPTKTNTYAYNTGVVLASNISEFVDFNVSYSANFNNSSTNGGNANSTNKYVNQVVGAQVNLLDKKGWFIQNDVTGNSYTGLSAGLNQNFWLWNAAIGKKILKKQAGEIKLSVFDLLKQNQSISRTITGPTTIDTQTKVLQQYFMLTFTYKLKNFGVAATRQGGGNFNRGGGGGFGGPPGGGGGGF
jgi:hypothetical protein